MNNQPKTTGSEGIWIPRAIWIARGLSLREKALLAEVRSADPVQGCRATNPQLTELLDIRERHLRSCIAALREKGFVTVRLDAQRERVIRSTGKVVRPAARQARTIPGPGQKPSRRRK